MLYKKHGSLFSVIIPCSAEKHVKSDFVHTWWRNAHTDIKNVNAQASTHDGNTRRTEKGSVYCEPFYTDTLSHRILSLSLTNRIFCPFEDEYNITWVQRLVSAWWANKIENGSRLDIFSFSFFNFQFSIFNNAFWKTFCNFATR